MLLRNFVLKLGRLLFVWFYAVISLAVLLGQGLKALWGNEKPFKARLKDQFSSPEVLRRIFSVLRAFKPNIGLKQRFISSYENERTVIVTRYQDVQEVLNRDDIFEVVYEPRMRKITGGQNFFLGMQNTPAYTRDVSNMRLIFRREDISKIVWPMASKMANEIVQIKGSGMDAVQDLTSIIPACIVQKYFGISSATQNDLIEWASLMFWYLFLDLDADKELEIKALKAAQDCRKCIDELISERKQSSVSTDDMLSRSLSMQKSNLPSMKDADIRNNFLGLLIGAIPTISMAATHALDQLLQRPAILKQAQRAALSDEEIFPHYVFEALRFHPVNPFIYRRANCDAVIARNHLREYRIRKDSMVLVSNLSAMFDVDQIAAPNRFRINRPWENYMLWGYGLHECFGAHFNKAVIPAILKPLLKQNKLRRAEGGAGQIQRSGTPFPVNMIIAY